MSKGLDRETQLGTGQLHSEPWFDVGGKDMVHFTKRLNAGQIDRHGALDFGDGKRTERAIENLRTGCTFDLPTNQVHYVCVHGRLVEI